MRADRRVHHRPLLQIGGGERLYIQLDSVAREDTWKHHWATPAPACVAR